MTEKHWEALSRCVGFDWEAGNASKIWEGHEVSAGETEQVFFNRPPVAAADLKHSETESRFLALGQTEAGRPLLVVFTFRRQLIRVISAREMNRREREEYERAE